MSSIESYVENLFQEVEDSQKKQEIVDEITLNLQDRVAELMNEGRNEEDAVNKAIVDFGDIAEMKRALINEQIGKEQKLAAFRLGYSIWGTVLLVALFCYINLYFTPKVIWCVFPIFGILWWPLTMYFGWMKRK
ncbi:MAG: permease prefix domain 1-containing protein [Spirochaetes bacterium]|nr:permease prefix domain 1-containing protein [Spirochaetota bacterium]